MESIRVTIEDDIDWYVERFGSTSGSNAKETIFLIPSGKATALRRNSIDHPGFSRTEVSEEAHTTVTPELISRQIINLLDELSIPQAVFFGNSSGGGAVLSIATVYPDRVRCGIVHEVPLESTVSMFTEAQPKSEEEIADCCEHFLANVFIEQKENDERAKWDALGRRIMRG